MQLPGVEVTNEARAYASVAVGAFVAVVIVPFLCIFLSKQLGTGKVSQTKANTLIFFLLPVFGWGATLFFQGLYIIRTPPLINKNTGIHIVMQPFLNYIIVPLRILGVNVSLLRMLICLYGFPTLTNGKIHLLSVSAAEKLQMGWMVSALLIMLIPYFAGFIWQITIRVHQRSILEVDPEDRSYWVTERPRDLRHYNIAINIAYFLLALVCVFLLWRRRGCLKRFDLDHSTYQATYVFFYGLFLIFANVQNYIEIERTKTYIYGVATPVVNEALDELDSLGWVNFTIAVLELALIIVLWVKSYQVAARPRTGHTTNSEMQRTLQQSDTRNRLSEVSVQTADMFPQNLAKFKGGKGSNEGCNGRPLSPPKQIGLRNTVCEGVEEERLDHVSIGEIENGENGSVGGVKHEGLPAGEVEIERNGSVHGGRKCENILGGTDHDTPAGGEESVCLPVGEIENPNEHNVPVDVEGGYEKDARAMSGAC